MAKKFLTMAIATITLACADVALAGCPKPASGGVITDDQVVQFTQEVSHLTKAEDTNKTIYKCFKKIRSGLNWNQAKLLIRTLESTYYSSERYSRNRTTDRMIELFVETHTLSIHPSNLLGILAAVSESKVHNSLLEDFVETNRVRISFAQLAVLVNGLASGNWDEKYNKSNTRDRILRDFMKARARALSTDVAIRIAAGMSESEDTNKLIEYFFKANIKTLTWTEVESLIANLESNYGNGRYSASKTRDRIVRAWQKR